MIKINYIQLIIVIFILTLLNSCVNNEKPKKKNGWSSENIKKLESIGNKAYEEDQYSNSIFIYSKLISIDSSQGKYYFRRGDSYSMIQNTDSALTDLLHAVNLGYKVSTAYQNIGAMYFSIIENDSIAIYYFRKSIEADPRNEKAKNLLEFCKKRMAKK